MEVTGEAVLPGRDACLAPSFQMWLVAFATWSCLFWGSSQGLTVVGECLRSKHSLCFPWGVSGLVGEQGQRHAWPRGRGLPGTPRAEGLPVSQAPLSPLDPRPFALGGHRRNAMCLVFLLGETDGGQEAFIFLTLT